MVFCPTSPASCEYYGYKYPYDGTKIIDDERNYDQPSRSSLMARPTAAGRPQDYYPQQSRDYALSNTVRCSLTKCPVNKGGYCEVPSLIQIDGMGRCKTGISFIDDGKPLDRAPPERRDEFTPEWFFNRYDTNCPKLSKQELQDYRSKGLPENWVDDVIRVNLERR